MELHDCAYLFKLIVDRPLVGEGSPWGAGEAYDKEFKLNYRMDPKIVDLLKGVLTKHGVVID